MEFLNTALSPSNDLPTKQEILDYLHFIKEDRKKDPASLNNNTKFQAAVLIQDVEVPLYYILGRMFNAISEKEFNKAVEQQDFSYYACIHYTGDSLDFNCFAIIPRKYIRCPKTALTMFQKCKGDGVLIEYYYNQLEWEYLDTLKLIELAYPLL